jgi:galactokinase
VNLIGEHTDYNGGFVLPMAVERQTVVAAAPADGLTSTWHSAAIGETVRIDLGGPVRAGQPRWANYVRGVVSGFQQLGVSFTGLDAVIDSDVPMGAGLASSAALEVAVATLLEGVVGRTLDPIEKALLCQRAERDFAGVPSGIMDQLISTLATSGHALLIDCQSLTVEPIPMADATVTVLIVNTNVRHDLADGEYARRRAECEEAATPWVYPRFARSPRRCWKRRSHGSIRLSCGASATGSRRTNGRRPRLEP